MKEGKRMRECGEARAYLEKLLMIDGEINAMLEHRQDILDMACRVTAAFSDTPGRRNADGTSPVEMGGVSLAAYSLEIDKRIDALVDLKREAMALISRLSDQRLALLLSLRYISALGWDKIMEKMGYERAQTFRLHNKALRGLQLLMDV